MSNECATATSPGSNDNHSSQSQFATISYAALCKIWARERLLAMPPWGTQQLYVALCLVYSENQQTVAQIPTATIMLQAYKLSTKLQPDCEAGRRMLTASVCSCKKRVPCV